MHFDPGDFVKGGLGHFGFHVRNGKYYAISHQHHYLGLVGEDDEVLWTAASRPVFDGVPNIAADLEYPTYATCCRTRRWCSRTSETPGSTASIRGR